MPRAGRSQVEGQFEYALAKGFGEPLLLKVAISHIEIVFWPLIGDWART